MFRFALLPVAAAELPLTMSWQQWKSTFGVAANGDDDARRAVFEATVDFIEAENKKGHSYTLGVNQFAHLTEQEFLETVVGANMSSGEDAPLMGLVAAGERADAVDWTAKGVVNAVPDQGQCGSCWAFAALGAIESANAIRTGALLKLAVQQLMDCADQAGEGCCGGLHDQAMTYIGKHGACSDASYPYMAKDWKDYDECQADETESGRAGSKSCKVILPAGAVTGYNIAGKSSDSLQEALNTMPVAVTMLANRAFQLYRSGVLSAPCPANTNVNHVALAVGYDGEAFKIRNSFGTSWGEQGYLRLAKQAGSEGAQCLFKRAGVMPTMAGSVTV